MVGLAILVEVLKMTGRLGRFVCLLALVALAASCARLQGIVQAPGARQPTSGVAVAWAIDLRLTAQLWQRARESAELGEAEPGAAVEGGPAAAEALRRRDAFRRAVAKRLPGPLEDAAREVGVETWGSAAAWLLAEATWHVQQAAASGDPTHRERGQELLRLADAAMESYHQATQAVLAPYGVEAPAPGSVRSVAYPGG